MGILYNSIKKSYTAVKTTEPWIYNTTASRNHYCSENYRTMGISYNSIKKSYTVVKTCHGSEFIGSI